MSRVREPGLSAVDGDGSPAVREKKERETLETPAGRAWRGLALRGDSR
jgi:hypothetical protein